MSRGVVTTEYTIWCGASDCAHWETDAQSVKKAEAIDLWRSQGWRKIRGVWTCRDCASGKPEPKPTKTNVVIWFTPSEPTKEAP